MLQGCLVCQGPKVFKVANIAQIVKFAKIARVATNIEIA